jgi:MoaA/NifB/PqqE/SkfB family radical SAM enzyme
MLLRGPQYVSWNYTYACNFNCSHCYSRAKRYPRELSTEKYRNIVSQLAEARVFKVGLGGGEPLIRSDCIDILDLMSRVGIDTNITTNGWFLDQDLARRLKAARLGTLYVSIDSHRPDNHNSFRRKSGSFERAIEATRQGVAAGLQVKFSTVLVNTNLDDIGQVVSLGERLGVEGIEFKRFRPAGNGVAMLGRYGVRAEREVALKEEIARIKSSTPLVIQLIYGSEEDGEADSGCPCGVRSICLRPNGDVCPCAYSETVIGSLSDMRLTDLWRDSPVLAAMRAQASCAALEINPSPSNPALSSRIRQAAGEFLADA